MKRIVWLLIGGSLLTACGTNGPTGLFTEVPAAESNTLVLPEGYNFKVLFKAGSDLVTRADGQQAPAKENGDFIGYLPIDGSSEHGYLYVSHETKNTDPVLGDGGGATVFEVQKTNGQWNVLGDFKHVNFEGVGGTLRNCGGVVTPHNTVLVAEEAEPASNSAMQTLGYGITDTSDFNGLKRYQNMGWMVEVDPYTQQALGKIYRMGRFMHEDAHCMPDGVTVYLTDDYDPAVFFKFVANKPGRYSQGQLYAWKQSADATGGEWLTLPMQIDSLMDIRNVAMRMGATIGVRHEWIDFANGKLIIAETGNDVLNWQPYVNMGATVAHYFEDKAADGANTYHDPYGRLLAFDPETNRMSVLLEGGASSDDATHFSSPDGLSVATTGGKEYIVVSEDLIGLSQGRVSAAAEAASEVYNELFFLDANKPVASVDDLKRFMTTPMGCETTGSIFTPDGSTLFLSIQHPHPQNPEPFNATCIIAIQGFPATPASATEAAPES